MKNRTWLTKIFVSVLVVILLLTTACTKSNDSGKENTNGENSANATPEATPVVTSEPKPQDGPLLKYAEPLKITIGLSSSAANQYVEGESIENNFHTRLNSEQLNIVYEAKFAVEDTKYAEKVNLSISSDDLPDVLRVDIDQLNRMIKNDQIADLTEVYEAYATDTVKESLGAKNNVAFAPATRDGKIYGIPRTRDFGDSIPILWLRADWLEKVGKQVPRTMDELLDVAKAFVEQDPDGNGIKDTYGLAMHALPLEGSITQTMSGVAAAFNAYPRLWVKDESGSLVYGSIKPAMKEALAALQKLFALKAIDAEFALKDYAKMSESLVAGKTGMLYGLFWNPIYPLQQNIAADPKARWVSTIIPGASGSEVIPPANLFAGDWVVVRKGFEHPEAVMKSINLWFDMNAGDGTSEAGKAWVDAVNGSYKGLNAHNYALPYFFDPPFRNLETSKSLIEYKSTKDASKLTESAKGIWETQIEPGGTNGWAFDNMYTEGIKTLASYKDYRYSDYNGAPTVTMASKGANLLKIENETFIKIIMGAAPLDEFDKFVQEYKSLGGDDITREVNEAARN